MLIHPTVERLRALGLTAMADAFIELQNAPKRFIKQKPLH